MNLPCKSYNICLSLDLTINSFLPRKLKNLFPHFFTDQFWVRLDLLFFAILLFGFFPWCHGVGGGRVLQRPLAVMHSPVNLGISALWPPSESQPTPFSLSFTLFLVLVSLCIYKCLEKVLVGNLNYLLSSLLQLLLDFWTQSTNNFNAAHAHCSFNCSCQLLNSVHIRNSLCYALSAISGICPNCWIFVYEEVQ